jgi:peptidoglycan hydrolase-like protein with peptidoglycan-binding domain
MLLKVGSKGEDVKKVQQKLGLTADGSFGPGTEKAVKAWQTANGLTADGIVGPASLAKMGITPSTSSSAVASNNTSSMSGKYSKEKIEGGIKKNGYKWFEGKEYLLNIVGVRNSDTGVNVTNAFDDKITVSYQVDGKWVYREWDCTVDPGTKGVKEFKNENGVARLVPGQYLDSHALGLHQGKYEALKQQKPVKVFRDKNRDMSYDEHTIQEGIFGINIHKAGKDSTFVENWSEGCQVFKREADFNEFMDIARKSASLGNKSFTYTLVNSKDIT